MNDRELENLIQENKNLWLPTRGEFDLFLSRMPDAPSAKKDNKIKSPYSVSLLLKYSLVSVFSFALLFSISSGSLSFYKKKQLASGADEISKILDEELAFNNAENLQINENKNK
jgi:hypothetical protein